MPSSSWMPAVRRTFVEARVEYRANGRRSQEQINSGRLWWLAYRWAAASALLALAAGCGGSVRLPPPLPRNPPVSTPSAPSASLQQLYESGRYQEVLSRVSEDTASAEALWFAAQSNLRLGRRADAARLFSGLPSAHANPAWRTTAQIALALLQDDPEAIDRRRAQRLLPTLSYSSSSVWRTPDGAISPRRRRRSTGAPSSIRVSPMRTTTPASPTIGSTART